jgi:ketol-acid reductoisomerase
MTANMKSKLANPFYPLLVIVGVVFCITACAYGVMTVKGLQPDAARQAATESGQQMMQWLDVNGFKLMMIELSLLAVTTVSAIATDEFGERRQRPKP